MPEDEHYVPLAIEGLYIDQSRCEQAVADLMQAADPADLAHHESAEPIGRALRAHGFSDAGSAYAGADERPYPRSFEVGGIWGDFVTMEDVRALLEALRPHLHRHPGVIVLGKDFGGRAEVALYTTPDGIEQDDGVDMEVEYLLSDGRSVRGFS